MSGELARHREWFAVREDDRIPYVGEGADGCRRSAEIDRTEAEGMHSDWTDRIAACLASAEAWELQAARLDSAGPTP